MRSAEENFARASSGFQADVRSTVRALFRAGNPAKCGKPDRLAFVRARGGWFGPDNRAPAMSLRSGATDLPVRTAGT
jgi:hypothetical protein